MSRRNDRVINLATGMPVESVDREEMVLAIADDSAGPLLENIDEVDAFCTKVERRAWGIYKKEGLIFHFQVVEPLQHAGTALRYFAQIKEEWRKRPMPRSSNLYAAASAALGHPAGRRDRIVYSLWLHRMFRCEIRQAKRKEDGKAYSVIARLIERKA